MSKAKGANPFARTAAVAKNQVERDREREGESLITRAKGTSLVPLRDVQGRLGVDRRPLRLDHVVDLARSIALWGLLQPPAVDQRLRIIAGAHRRAALLALCYVAAPGDYRTSWFSLWPTTPDSEVEQALDALRATSGDIPLLNLVEDWYRLRQGQVPVIVLPFDSEIETDRARLLEIVENEKRRGFTRDEIRQAATEMREAGYRNVPGRPKEGEQSLKMALAQIFGTSYSTVRRALAEEPNAAAPSTSPARQGKALAKRIDRFLAVPGLPEHLAGRLKELTDELRKLEA